jgi:membrane-bound metal-dependent hydrolase YbcI (DUF457 family)
MFFWFLGTAAITVWFIFRDDRFDYRVLAIGALIPDVVDYPLGGAWFMHSIVTSVGVLVAVVLVYRRGSLGRRRWLALPIGMFLHLVFDGVFNNTALFWWPLAGFDVSGVNVPALDRMQWNGVLEIVGVIMLLWLWKKNSLSQRQVRQRFVRTGQLLGGHDTQVGKC